MNESLNLLFKFKKNIRLIPSKESLERFIQILEASGRQLFI